MTPDFTQKAFDIVQRIWRNTELDQPGLILETAAVAEQLRQLWNARGLEDEDAVFMELGGPTPECFRAAGAIRILDR